MFQAGCVALVIAGGSLCFSGKQITCSDQPIAGIETCKCQAARAQLQMDAAKKLGICSQDGSTCSGFLPIVATTGC